MAGQFDTHDVFNQAPPLQGYDVFAADQALGEALDREGAAWARPELGTLGALAGSAEAQELGRLANENDRSCTPTTAMATGSTWSSTTRPTTTS